MRVRTWFLEQLAMYTAYHRDPRNQLTHHLGVPLIVFSLLIALSQVPLGQVGSFTVSLATVTLGALLLLYLICIPVTGIFAAMFYAAVYALVLKVGELPPVVNWTVAGAGFVAGWAIQFLGHFFEGRRPALTVNALQVFMAPAYLIAEMLFAAGFESSLAAELQRRAVKYLPTEGAA
jgi:uncharacterized membrane protein YGL010W